MSHQYVISLDCESPMWLLHRIWEDSHGKDLREKYNEDSVFAFTGKALRFPRIDDAVEALRDADESAQVRVVW